MKTTIRARIIRLARTAWTCFFCGEQSTGNGACTECGC